MALEQESTEQAEEPEIENLLGRVINLELAFTLMGIVIDKHLTAQGKANLSRVMESFLTVAKNAGHDIEATIEMLELRFPE